MSEDVRFMFDGTVTFENDTPIGSIDFGDEDNTKLFKIASNDDSVVMIILDNIYDDSIKIGEVASGLNDKVVESFKDGSVKPYMAMTFPSDENGVESIDAIINNLTLIKEHILEGENE